jgi:hypothetical protein
MISNPADFRRAGESRKLKIFTPDDHDFLSGHCDKYLQQI